MSLPAWVEGHLGSPRAILDGLSDGDRDTMLSRDAPIYDSIVQHLNSLPYVYASEYPHLQQDRSVLSLGHPCFFKPSSQLEL